MSVYIKHINELNLLNGFKYKPLIKRSKKKIIKIESIINEIIKNKVKDNQKPNSNPEKSIHDDKTLCNINNISSKNKNIIVNVNPNLENKKKQNEESIFYENLSIPERIVSIFTNKNHFLCDQKFSELDLKNISEIILLFLLNQPKFYKSIYKRKISFDLFDFFDILHKRKEERIYNKIISNFKKDPSSKRLLLLKDEFKNKGLFYIVFEYFYDIKNKIVEEDLKKCFKITNYEIRRKNGMDSEYIQYNNIDYQNYKNNSFINYKDKEIAVINKIENKFYTKRYKEDQYDINIKNKNKSKVIASETREKKEKSKKNIKIIKDNNSIKSQKNTDRIEDKPIKINKLIERNNIIERNKAKVFLFHKNKTILKEEFDKLPFEKRIQLKIESIKKERRRLSSIYIEEKEKNKNKKYYNSKIIDNSDGDDIKNKTISYNIVKLIRYKLKSKENKVKQEGELKYKKLQINHKKKKIQNDNINTSKENAKYFNPSKISKNKKIIKFEKNSNTNKEKIENKSLKLEYKAEIKKLLVSNNKARISVNNKEELEEKSILNTNNKNDNSNKLIEIKDTDEKIDNKEIERQSIISKNSKDSKDSKNNYSIIDENTYKYNQDEDLNFRKNNNYKLKTINFIKSIKSKEIEENNKRIRSKSTIRIEENNQEIEKNSQKNEKRENIKSVKKERRTENKENLNSGKKNNKRKNMSVVYNNKEINRLFDFEKKKNNPKKSSMNYHLNKYEKYSLFDNNIESIYKKVSIIKDNLTKNEVSFFKVLELNRKKFINKKETLTSSYINENYNEEFLNNDVESNDILELEESKDIFTMLKLRNKENLKFLHMIENYDKSFKAEKDLNERINLRKEMTSEYFMNSFINNLNEYRKLNIEIKNQMQKETYCVNGYYQLKK